ncbi:MAG: gamma-glutamyl-gamma-aminobutyrate hydrolase family protein [Chloroflexi bacterium]|nr:gamma-glutamyl-gamma-aminobutyrate hydrolase family protein [Chloroflexota bacterium]
MRTPRIVITFGGKTPAQVIQNYTTAIERAGGEPVAVFSGEEIVLEAFDGLLLSGGGDINPARYGQSPDPRTAHVDDRRDEFELALARAALHRDLPVLGICRGFQLLNVVAGGTLLQHVEGHQHGGQHPVTVLAGTRLAQALGTSGEVIVNTRHHQAVRAGERAPDLVTTAFSPDGLIEGLESPTHRWVVGVQCHPERTGEVDPRFSGLFRAFIAAARAR